MDTNDEFSEIGACRPVDLKPIYTSDPVNSATNLSCSCSNDFCYLCSYIDSPRGPDSIDLNEHIKLLIAEGKEIQARLALPPAHPCPGLACSLFPLSGAGDCACGQGYL